MSHIDIGIWAMVVLGTLGGLTAVAWAAGKVIAVLSRLRVARAQERILLAEARIRRQALEAKRRQEALEHHRGEIERQTDLTRAKQELARTKNATVAEEIRQREAELARVRMDVARLEAENRRLQTGLPTPPAVDASSLASEVVDALRHEGVFSAMNPEPIVAAVDERLGVRLRETSEHLAQLIGQQLQAEIAQVQQQVTEVGNLFAGVASSGVDPAVVAQTAHLVESIATSISALNDRVGNDGHYLAQQIESLRTALTEGRESGGATAGSQSQTLVDAIRGAVVTALEDSLEAFRVSLIESSEASPRAGGAQIGATSASAS